MTRENSVSRNEVKIQLLTDSESFNAGSNQNNKGGSIEILNQDIILDENSEVDMGGSFINNSFGIRSANNTNNRPPMSKI